MTQMDKNSTVRIARDISDEVNDLRRQVQLAEFERLFRDNYATVHAQSCLLASSEEEAREITSRAFLQAAHNYDAFDPSVTSFSAWVSSFMQGCAVGSRGQAAQIASAAWVG